MENHLSQILETIKAKIPEQGPLEYFVHHNTIHHYEYLNFFEAVKKASIDFDSNAFMPEEFYLHKYNKRKLKRSDLASVAKDFLQKHKLSLPLDILMRLLLDREVLVASKNQKFIQETQARYFSEKPYFFTKIIGDDLGVDIDFYVCPTVYRFLSAYFDYGVASWLLANRQEGLWKRFCYLHRSATIFDNAYRRKLSKVIRLFETKTSLEVIQAIIQSLEISTEYLGDFLFETCLKHKGWAGFIKSIEKHPEWIQSTEIIPSFTDFLAISLLCDYSAILLFTKTQSKTPRFRKNPLHSAQFLNHFYSKFEKYTDIQQELKEALPFLTDFNRQEIFHRAYEKSFYNMFLSAYSNGKTYVHKKTPAYQVVCCIDDREESFRRYLEMNLDCETFGCAGHFGLNILFKGYFNKRYRPLCPVNVKPDFKVTETAVTINQLRHKILLLWGELQWFSTISSKTMVRGAFQTFINGIFSMVPLVLDVINPSIMFKFKNKILDHLKTSVATKLVYKKEENTEGIDFKSRLKFAESFLRMIGLLDNFSPYIFIVGHGSSSLNNPHEAAYDCGACGGGRGAPNARLMAYILNEVEIREALKKQGIEIPPETIFIASYHNTCSDEIEFFEIQSLIKQNSFLDCLEKIKKAAALNAVERCRRFQVTPTSKDPEAFLNHVRSRSVDLRQPRPEYGHATNALCVIGPRSYTRNLFLDRRAFLVSYSPETDPTAPILKKLLDAAIPVCSGINLEFYFSFVDNEKYGCGTKLPHNVNALVGVINGHMSDLRLGLTWQVVEIHQPIRLFVKIIAKRQVVEDLLGQQNIFALLVKNEWINLAVHDPESHNIWVYKDNRFEEHQSVGYPLKYLPCDDRILMTKSHVDFGIITPLVEQFHSQELEG